jgi:hypothetical protein
VRLNRLRWSIPVAAALAAVLVGVSANPAHADSFFYANFVHRNTSPDQCLDLRGEDSFSVQTWECVHNANQAWRISFVTTGTNGEAVYQVIVKRNQRCLGIWQNSLNAGAVAQVQPCSISTSTLTQLWYKRGTLFGSTLYSTFVNFYSGYCLDVRDNFGGNAAIVQQYYCNGSDAQRWRDANA